MGILHLIYNDQDDSGGDKETATKGGHRSVFVLDVSLKTMH